MKFFGNNDEKARKALQEAASRTSLATAALEAHELASFDPGDPNSVRAYHAKSSALQTDLATEQGVLSHWQGVVAQFDAEAEARAEDAAHAGEEKQARADAQLFPKLEKQIAAVFETLQLVEESRTRTAAANKRRGHRPFIEDCEYRVRSRPGKMQTRIVDTNRVWVDAHGEVVKAEVWDDRNGRYIRNPEAVNQIDKEFVVREEMQLPPEMPERLADAIKLVNLQGEVIWPPRPVGRTGSYM